MNNARTSWLVDLFFVHMTETPVALLIARKGLGLQDGRALRDREVLRPRHYGVRELRCGAVPSPGGPDDLRHLRRGPVPECGQPDGLQTLRGRAVRVRRFLLFKKKTKIGLPRTTSYLVGTVQRPLCVSN